MSRRHQLLLFRQLLDSSAHHGSHRSASTAAVIGPLPRSGCPFAPQQQPQVATNVQTTPSTEWCNAKAYSQLPSPTHLPLLGTIPALVRAGGSSYLHTYCDMRHKTLGPIYMEKMGGTDCVFIADSELMQKVYQNEGKFPQHMVPEPWTIYNEKHGIQRGLFFM